MKTHSICIVEFHRPEMKIPTFAELIGAMVGEFTNLGLRTVYRQGGIEKGAVNIVFGSHRLFQAFENVSPFPDNCIFFNLEPLQENSSEESHRRYLELLKKSLVIDYAPKNCELLERTGSGKTFRFLFGYIPLTPFRFPAPDECLCFYGLLTDRRKAILERVMSSGIAMRGTLSNWGYERDYEICTSRAVLNISRFDNYILEVYRLWHSLSLGTPVITERGADRALADEWQKYVCFVDDVRNLTKADLGRVPGAELYKRDTSFAREILRLKEWIESC